MTRHAFVIDGTEQEIVLTRAAGRYLLQVDGAVATVALIEDAGRGCQTLQCDGNAAPIVIAAVGDEIHIHLDGTAYTLRYRHPLDRLSQNAEGKNAGHIRAPMPGVAVSVVAAVGKAVAKGDVLIVMESMKLETAISAPRDGTIEAVHVAPGQSFERDAELVTLVAEEQAP
jgi:biotin carboxyl carrier protein